MSVNAKDVMKLRKSTGAGMMDCKKALAEAEGDFDRAIEVIRERGKAIASKRADREASEGGVLAKSSEDGTYGAMIVLNCETDFVAKNDSFVSLAMSFLDAAIANKPADLDALKAIEIKDPEGNVKPISEIIAEQTGIMGEKLDLSFFQSTTADYIASYIHAGNKLATLIGFNKAIDATVGKDIAMQAAAMAPIAIDKDGVSEETKEQELKIAMEKFRQEGKPEAMLEKIAQGSLNKFFKENTLMAQTFVKDGKISVADHLATADKDAAVITMVRRTL